MKFLFLTDPLVTTFGAVKPALLLSIELQKLGFDVGIISPKINKDLRKVLTEHHIHFVDLGMNFRITPMTPNFEAWMKSLFKSKVLCCSLNSFIVINTSSCILAESHVYFAQGPMTKALDDMVLEMPRSYKYAYTLIAALFRRFEERMVKKFRQNSWLLIANSKFCASMYNSWGIQVDNIIYPPLNCNLFKPATKKPAMSYVLTYIGAYGKESKFSVLKKVADEGVKIKAFGYKANYVPDEILRHPNIEFLGTVSDNELVDFYSNARYTLFTFTHEPFGYVPVESMACCTPVLTYNIQGPSESVINEVTGWLANNDDEIVKIAINIWKNGYPSWMRLKCRERALEFDVKNIADKWLKVLRSNDIY